MYASPVCVAIGSGLKNAVTVYAVWLAIRGVLLLVSDTAPDESKCAAFPLKPSVELTFPP